MATKKEIAVEMMYCPKIMKFAFSRIIINQSSTCYQYVYQTYAECYQTILFYLG
jgi:hypothetical protein